MTKTLPLVLALALATATAAHADDDDTNAIDDTPHITIVGTATHEAAPDLATITLGVTKQAPSAKAAADAASRVAQAIVDEAKAQGVAPADIATQRLSLSQTFADQRDAQGHVTGRQPSGFAAAETLSIRIRDLAKAGPLAQGLIDKGANEFDGIAFTVEHPQPLLDRLAAEAVANARHQAELVAQAAGTKLGRVLLVERPEAGGGPVVAMPMRLAVAAPKALPIEPGSETLSAEMQVTWAIDQP